MLVWVDAARSWRPIWLFKTRICRAAGGSAGCGSISGIASHATVDPAWTDLCCNSDLMAKHNSAAQLWQLLLPDFGVHSVVSWSTLCCVVHSI